MKHLFFLVIVLLVGTGLFAQQNHFVYIQADNQQPFYLKYNGKNYSSSSIGYLILPKLSNGTFTVQIGFPMNLFPEQTFNLTVDGKDYGYALKNFDSKGWGLFNFQTTDIVMNVNAAAAGSPMLTSSPAPAKANNPFGSMLANAVNDSTLTVTSAPPVNPAQATTQKVETSEPAAASPSETATAADSNRLVKKERTSINTTAETPDTATAVNAPTENKKEEKQRETDTAKAIVKSSENSNKEGTQFTFLDQISKDTIRAFIPSADTPQAASAKTDHITVEAQAAVADTAKTKVNNPFFDGSSNTDSNSAVYSSSSVEIKPYMVNTSCQVMFSSYEFDKLKKKISGKKKTDDMLQAVRKSLREKCITTEQVQNLGELFTSDEDRYLFYDAAYPFVYDYGNFPKLENQLVDTYYKNRFKALMR